MATSIEQNKIITGKIRQFKEYNQKKSKISHKFADTVILKRKAQLKNCGVILIYLLFY